MDTAAPPPDSTSIVIVAADSGAALIECVARVLREGAPVEIIVADNDSRDGSIEALAAQQAQEPRLRIVRNGRNLGFGAACNRGAALARGDALVFLNPDCWIEPGAIARLREALAADPRIGLLGVSQTDAQGRIDPASRRRDPLLRRALMSLSGLARRESRHAAFAGVALPVRDEMPASEAVDAVSGALMALPRAVFAHVGGFDEGYFLHCEDLDLCRRVRDAGWRVVCANDLRATHGKGGSSRRRPTFVAWHKHRGMWRWFVKFDPAARNPALRALVFCGIWLAFALKLPVLGWRRLFGAFAP